jgi:hypothetical protein
MVEYRLGGFSRIHGIRRLTPGEFQLLGGIKEDILYECGSALFVASELDGVCCVEQNVNCYSHISTHYFSCKKKFQVCCYNVWQFWRPHSNP